MANALRPAVVLIVIASLMFFAAGWLDSAAGATDVSTYASWGFGAVNLLVAALIARGNERILALRIGLAAFFMVERPVTAVAFGAKPVESAALHVATAILEAVILFSTLRIWRLGHSVGQADLAFLQLPAPPLAVASGAPFALTDAAAGGPLPGSTLAEAKTAERGRSERPPRAQRPLDARPRPAWGFRLIGLLALLLAVTLVGDAVARGILPGAAVDLSTTAWLGYLFALVVLVVASRAVHQGRFAVRMLLVVALIVFVERAFSPFAGGDASAASFGLDLAGALVALALALACAASLRATRSRRSALP